MKCPLKNSKCVPATCMFGMKLEDGTNSCGILIMMHNIMVIAQSMEKKDGG